MFGDVTRSILHSRGGRTIFVLLYAIYVAVRVMLHLLDFDIYVHRTNAAMQRYQATFSLNRWFTRFYFCVQCEMDTLSGTHKKVAQFF